MKNTFDLYAIVLPSDKEEKLETVGIISECRIQNKKMITCLNTFLEEKKAEPRTKCFFYNGENLIGSVERDPHPILFFKMIDIHMPSSLNSECLIFIFRTDFSTIQVRITNALTIKRIYSYVRNSHTNRGIKLLISLIMNNQNSKKDNLMSTLSDTTECKLNGVSTNEVSDSVVATPDQTTKTIQKTLLEHPFLIEVQRLVGELGDFHQEVKVLENELSQGLPETKAKIQELAENFEAKEKELEIANAKLENLSQLLQDFLKANVSTLEGSLTSAPRVDSATTEIRRKDEANLQKLILTEISSTNYAALFSPGRKNIKNTSKTTEQHKPPKKSCWDRCKIS